MPATTRTFGADGLGSILVHRAGEGYFEEKRRAGHDSVLITFVGFYPYISLIRIRILHLHICYIIT
jgi:hypothetical protein